MTTPPVPLGVVSTTVSHGPEDLSRSRRRGVAVLCAVAALLALAVAFTATAQSNEQAQVTFITPDGHPYPVLLEGVTPDIQNATYTLRGVDGTTRDVTVASGYSIQALSDAWNATTSLSISPYPWAQIPRGDRDPLVLRRQQLTDDTDGQKAVVYVGEDDQVHFLRPRNADKDTNGNDEIVDPTNITFRLLKKHPITITAEAVPKHAKVGEKITFSGSVTAGAASGETFKYSWNGPNNIPNGTGRTITHTYDKPGTYKATVFVNSSVSEAQESRTVRVVVGKAKESDKDQEGGGTNEDDDAPDSGASTGSTGTGNGSTGYTAPYSGYDPGTSSPVTPAPVTPAVTPPPAQTTPKPPPTETTPKEKVPTTSGGTEVQGTVLTGLSLAAATIPPAAATKTPDAADEVAARTGTPKKLPDPTGGLHVPAGVWILLLLVLLLIGGFWQDAYRAVAPRSIPRIP